MGIKIEIIDITREVPVSKVETIGLVKPPVEIVDANLVVLEMPAMAV